MRSLSRTISLYNFLEASSLPHETSWAVWDFCINGLIQFLLTTCKTDFLFQWKEALEWSTKTLYPLGRKASSAGHSSRDWAEHPVFLQNVALPPHLLPPLGLLSLPHCKYNPSTAPEKPSSVKLGVPWGPRLYCMYIISLFLGLSKMLNVWHSVHFSVKFGGSKRICRFVSSVVLKKGGGSGGGGGN